MSRDLVPCLCGLVVLDNFHGHLGENVRRELEELGAKISINPGEFAPVLQQPLDVCLNKPFKDSVHCLCTDWVAQGGLALTPIGKIKWPSVDLVGSLFLDAWHLLPADLTSKSPKEAVIFLMHLAASTTTPCGSEVWEWPTTWTVGPASRTKRRT